jgi:hypothetical protein
LSAFAAALVLSLVPNPAHFGDVVTAKLGPGSPPSFAPFAIRAKHGSTYELQCLDSACAPGAGGRRFTLGGKALVILPRATNHETEEPLRSFRRQTSLRPTSYTIRPRLLQGFLFGIAAALIALAIIVTWPLFRRLVPEPVDPRTPLQRALDLVRASLRRSSDDRRRALDVLGRALAGRPLARDALGLAWSRREPDVSQTESFVDSVERDP